MKKILFVLAIIAASVSAHASYLYWQIDGSEEALSGKDYNAVRIYASNDGGATDKHFLNLGYADYASGTFQEIGYAVSAPLQGGSLIADVSSYSDGTYSFYVELINTANLSCWNDAANKNVSAYQNPDFAGQLQGATAADTTYSSLAASGYIGADLSPVSMAVWHGGANYSPVPEPTSAMLMLIGIAGLALRRRAV